MEHFTDSNVLEKLNQLKKLKLELARKHIHGSEDELMASLVFPRSSCTVGSIHEYSTDANNSTETQMSNQLPKEKSQETLNTTDIIQTMVLQNIQFQQLVMSRLYLNTEQTQKHNLNSIATQTIEYKSSNTNKSLKLHTTDQISQEIFIQREERVENTSKRARIAFIAVLFLQILKRRGIEKRENRLKVQYNIINNGKLSLLRILKGNTQFNQAINSILQLNTDILGSENTFKFFKSKSKQISDSILGTISQIISSVSSITCKSDDKDMKNVIQAFQLLTSAKIFKGYYLEVELDVLPLEINQKLLGVEYKTLLLYFIMRVIVQLILVNPVESLGLTGKFDKLFFKNLKVLGFLLLRIVRGVCGQEGQMANTSPEFLIGLDSKNSNTFTDQAFKKFFKSNQNCIVESETRLAKWVEEIYKDLQNLNLQKIGQSLENRTESGSVNDLHDLETDETDQTRNMEEILLPCAPTESLQSEKLSSTMQLLQSQSLSLLSGQVQPVANQEYPKGSLSQLLSNESQIRLKDQAQNIVSSHSLKIQDPQIPETAPNTVTPIVGVESSK